MKRENGYTLIEIMFVVAIVSVLVMMVAPKIDVAKYRLDAAGQAVGATLLAVQRQSITQQHDIIVQLDVATQSLRVHEDRNNNGLQDVGERVRGIPLGEHVMFGLGGATPRPMGGNPINFTNLVGGKPAVTFHRDGSASEAGGFYMTFAAGNRAKDTRAVEIERATGRAVWYRFSPPSTWKRIF